MAKETTITEELRPFYSIYEAAELLGVSDKTLRRRIKEGTLKAGKVGQQWRISRDDLLEFIAPQN